MRAHVTATDTSATGSRSVRNTVPRPGRRVNWVTWPSTHIAPSWPIHCDSALEIARTGAGASAVVSRREGTAASLVPAADAPPTMRICPPVRRLATMTTDLAIPRVLSPDERAVLLAAPRGYCAGVDRAVVTVEQALDLYGAPVYVRKQIVHNKHVVSDLESRGAIFVEELDEVPTGATVVFSAHGVSPEVHRQAGERELKTIDATCPLVTKVHHEAKRFAGEDYDILLIGHEGHEEVEGTAGEAPDHIQLVQSPDDVAGIEVRDPEKVAWLTQTTLSVDETMATVAAIRERFPALLDPPSDDICYATQNRQLAIKEIARDADLVIVVGSGNSSNSVRLVEVALEAGARSAYRVDDAGEIDEAWLDGVSTVSVTSGASVPEELVDGVLSFLAEHGYPDAQAVHSAEESLIFALPKELRRDLKAAAQAGGKLGWPATSTSTRSTRNRGW